MGEEDTSEGGSGPAPLPVIVDRGPPTAQNYENPNIYWNSVMIEADEDDKVRLAAGPRKRGHSEARRSGLPDLKESFEHMGLDHVSEDIQTNGVNSPSVDIAAAQERMHGSGPAHGRERHGEEQAGHDLTVMAASVPDYLYSPAHSLTPGTRACDDFMDPLEYTPRSRLPNPRQHQSTLGEQVYIPQPTRVILEEKDLPSLPHEHRSLVSSSQATRKTSPLTWNTCLSEIIGHDNIDQDMAGRVKERVKSRTTTNGDGLKEHSHVTTIEAGLVPNFSYPVVGGPFYDRILAAQSPPPALTNGTINEATNRVPSNSNIGDNSEADRHESTITNRSIESNLDFNFNLPPSPSTTSSLYRAPTPPSPSPTRLRLTALLTEILSPSEHNLCQTVLRPPLASPPVLDPLPTRLTLSLHRALLHLQDRVCYLEDNLLPRLGAALEKKRCAIDLLSGEVRRLDGQVREVKGALDFGNKILEGCWVREWEVLRTLQGIREGRVRRKWWRWGRGKRGGGEGGGSMDGKVKALVGMARQNVEILREDVHDLIEKVERCKSGDYVPESAVERVEGSWRDV